MFQWLKDEFNIKKILAYVRARTPRTYLGPVLFPSKTVDQLDFEYFKDENVIPVMAKVQTFGVESEIASREGVELVKGSIPAIKRKINLDEKYLIALKREGLGDKALVKDRIFKDLDSMIDAFWARVEQMRMDIIANGQLVLNENGVIMTVNYQVPDALKETLTGNSLWSDTTNSTPITDIQGWVESVVNNSGIRPTRALTSNTVAALLIQNAQIRTMIYGDNGGTRAVSLKQVNALLEGLSLPQIATYDVKVRSEAADGSKTTSRFFPEEKFVLLPEATLGETLLGPTAEALTNPDVAYTDSPGVFGQVYTGSFDPPVIWTKVAGTSIPTFPMADSVFQAVVKAS